jgi:2-dehydro-3-deoxygalactonokinase
MKFFFSCDWGTSTFRLRLIDVEDLAVLCEIKTGHGIASAFQFWKETGADEKNRIDIYCTYLFEKVQELKTSFNHSIENIPVILSGMASSSIGMIELPYKEIPFQGDGSDLIFHTIVPGDWANQIIIISGVKSEEDVIRGEETMLAGCTITDTDIYQLFIFPGTHSKHVKIKNLKVKGFATYMTGELFDLLSSKSILSASINKGNAEDSPNSKYFFDGVKKGASSNLMNCIFHVRTNQLFKKLSPEENYKYLSGLLIGHELKDVPTNHPGRITLVCNEPFTDLYVKAAAALGFGDVLHVENANDALIKGQWKIFQHRRFNFFNK